MIFATNLAFYLVGKFTNLGQIDNCNPDDFSDPNATDPGCDTVLPQVTADANTVQDIFAFVFLVLGAVSILMIIIGGITMVTFGGESQKVAKARETITYALIGLVVAISAEFIIYFLLGNV